MQKLIWSNFQFLLKKQLKAPQNCLKKKKKKNPVSEQILKKLVSKLENSYQTYP